MNINKETIAIIGMGYVGLPLAVEFGKTRHVIGFDINQKRINELVSGKDVTLEVTSQNLKKAKLLKFSTDDSSLKQAKVFIITVPTPIDKANRPNLKPIIEATKSVSKFLKKNDLVIYESTVYPGCTEEICVPILEENSGLKFNKDFYCGYSPERINPGDKVNTLVKIRKITSGSSKKASKLVDDLYKSIIKAGTYLASSIRVAEAAKVIENTQRDLNIALVNELSVLFNRLNIDTIEVLEAAGTKWNFLPFRPGMVGGHCIGVDPYYLTYKAEEVGYHPQIISSGRRMNDNMARYSARNIIKLMIQNNINVSKSKVGVLGITFKENCPDIRNSKVIDLINELKDWGVKVLVSDPYANSNEVKLEYGLNLSDIEKFNNLDVIIIAVGHKIYRNIDLRELKKLFKSKKPILADLKSIHDKASALKMGFTIFRL